jgi:hypothetical protein
LDQQAAVGSKLIRSAIFSNAPEAAGDYQVQKALEKSGLTESPYSDKKKSTLAGASLYSGDASSAVPTESEHAADAAADEEDSKAPKKKKSFLSFLKGG